MRCRRRASAASRTVSMRVVPVAWLNSRSRAWAPPGAFPTLSVSCPRVRTRDGFLRQGGVFCRWGMIRCEHMFDGLIPQGLDEMEPGPALAGFLASIDVGELSGHDRIVVLRAHQRMVSCYTARVYEDMAAVVDRMHQLGDDRQLAEESAAAEIRAALHLTRRAADIELGWALDLEQRLPQVWELLAAGDIDVRRAKAIIVATSHLPVETARDVVDQVIDLAPELTVGQLTARLRRLCIAVDPQQAQRRYDDAVAERRVIVEPNEAGTANLSGFDLPPHRVAAITRRINRLARTLRAPDESRTMDQLRADVFMDLLAAAGGTVAADRGVVDIHVDLETLTGLSEAPGELAGYGPVIADIARQVVGRQERAEWRFVVTDPDTGLALHDGITRRRPSVEQRRFVEIRDRTCVFPGCRMPAADCDLDHRDPYAQGGPTDPTNLAPLCRHDHRIRHHAGWTYRSLPNGGHEWTSRLGHRYTTCGQSP
ncbi:MAG TPA: HNH endonuclease [Actinobacteria bacterium]|nr:HNH endonuclease [Actinomycetota bacterium]